MSDPDRLRRYALGSIPEDAAEDLEQRLLVDEDLHQQLERIEDGLVEDYLSGALDAGDRASFEARLARDARLGEHARHAALLRERLAGATPARPGVARYWTLLAAVLVLALAALLWRLRPHAEPAPGQDARTSPRPGATATPPGPTRTEPPPAAVASLTLSPGQTMSEGEEARITLTPDVETLRLELMIEGAPAPAYAAELFGEAGGRVWRGDNLPADRGVGVVRVAVPAQGLAAGRYRLELAPQAGRPAGPRPYYFELRRLSESGARGSRP